MIGALYSLLYIVVVVDVVVVWTKPSPSDANCLIGWQVVWCAMAAAIAKVSANCQHGQKAS